MSDFHPPFDREELVTRADRARALMEHDGIDALIVTGDFAAGMNYYYLSGHLPRDYQLNYSRPHVMVLPREGDPFLWVYGVNERTRAVSRGSRTLSPTRRRSRGPTWPPR